jgi:hypothetical protein
MDESESFHNDLFQSLFCWLHCLFCMHIEAETPYVIVKYFISWLSSCVTAAELMWPPYVPQNTSGQ